MSKLISLVASLSFPVDESGAFRPSPTNGTATLTATEPLVSGSKASPNADGVYSVILTRAQSEAFGAVLSDPKALAAAVKAGHIAVPTGTRGRTAAPRSSIAAIMAAAKATAKATAK